MTDDEIKIATEAALDNSLAIVKTWFPTLLGHGLVELSKDQRILVQASRIMEQRLVEKNRDDEYFIDEGDRKIGSYVLTDYRNLTKFLSK